MYFRKKGSKYNNTKVVYDNLKFDSKAEMNRYIELKLLEKAGEIEGLKTQIKFTLQDKFKIDNKTIRAITYTADFVYKERNIVIVEDLKSWATSKDKTYQLKKKMMIKLLCELSEKEGIKHQFKEVIK